MTYQDETDLLFDDTEILRNIFGEGTLTLGSVNTDCDCISYDQILDNGDFDTKKSPGASSATH